MLRWRKIATGAAGTLAVAIAITAAYIWAARHRAPTTDEFSVYAAFLSRLSKDDKLCPDRLALADTSFKLVAVTPDNWIPAELRPYPPNEAEASERFIDFCGAFCGRDFMAKNLRAWQLKPASAVRFPFDILATSAEGGKRVVTVTRPGFDLWHHRAVFSYSFGCSAGGSATEDAVLCVQFGQVLVQRTNDEWQVISYDASVV
jgi:hypothetical protein